MNSLFDRSLPPSKASPFVNHPVKASGPASQIHAAKPVTSPAKMDRVPAPAKEQKAEAEREPLVLTVKEAAAWLKFSQKKIYEYINDGLLKPLPGSRSYRIPFSQIKALCGG